MSKSCNHRYNNTIHTSTLKIALNHTDPANCDPSNPSNHHHTANAAILPIWNLSCVIRLFPVCTDSAYQITIPPVTAKQVDTDATKPITSATPNPSVSYCGIRLFTLT